MLAYHDLYNTFTLDNDASEVAVGAVITKE